MRLPTLPTAIRLVRRSAVALALTAAAVAIGVGALRRGTLRSVPSGTRPLPAGVP